HPLFQVMLAVENLPEGDRPLELPGLRVQPLPPADDGLAAKFDLTVSLGERRAERGAPAGLVGGIQYAVDLFDRATVEGLADRLVRVLDQAAARPDRRIGDLDILSSEERQRLL